MNNLTLKKLNEFCALNFVNDSSHMLLYLCVYIYVVTNVSCYSCTYVMIFIKNSIKPNINYRETTSAFLHPLQAR